MSKSIGSNVLVADAPSGNDTVNDNVLAPVIGAATKRHVVPLAENERETRERFEELLRATRPRIYRLAYVQLHNASDAEDVTQETFVRAWIHFSSYDRTRPFSAWALRIATNLIVDYSRRRKRRQAISLDAPVGTSETAERLQDLIDPACDPAASLIANQLNEALFHAIQSLPAHHRQSIGWLAQDYTYEQIAELMQCPMGTVRSRVHRARLQLRHICASTIQEKQ